MVQASNSLADLGMPPKKLFKPDSDKPFPLSRTGLEKFVNCPRCFYLHQRLGVRPPAGPPFSINSAVDHLLKKEFDHYRRLGQPHPYMTEAGLNAVPYADSRLESWRNNFKGVRALHEQSGFEVFGAVDDVWIDRESGQLVVADYKATAKDSEVNLDSDWQAGYKRQMEVYQWLLRQTGFEVSDTGYFVYCNGDKSAARFDGVVRFKVSLIPYTGSDSWVEEALQKAKACLEADGPPEAATDCKQCVYLEKVRGLTLFM